MCADMADAVNYANLLGLDVAAVAGYIDGPQSAWPAEAWSSFGDTPILTISVLGSPEAMAFDVEAGNASIATVRNAVTDRTIRGLPSVIYCGEGTEFPGAWEWCHPALWPEPGCYLWAATPGKPWKYITVPVAVQDRYPGPYDLSTLYDGWLPVIPQPNLSEEEKMSLACSADGSVAYAVGKGNGRTTHLLRVTPGKDPGTFSIIDVTVQVSNQTGAGTPPFTVAP